MDRLLRRLLSEAGGAPKRRSLAGGNPVGQILPNVSTQPTPGDPQGPARGVSCDWELVAAYAEGQLGLAEREKLEDHLSQCVACRRMANAMLEERPDVAEAAEEKHAAGPWWLRWNWNWAVPALATALIVGSVVFYQRDQVLRHAAGDRTAARQVVEKGAGGQPAGRSAKASIPSHDREGAVVKSETGQPTEGQPPPASPSPGNKQAALSDKKEAASNIPAGAPRATNAIAEPSDKTEAVQVPNSPPSPLSIAPPGNAPQAAQAPPAPHSPPAQYQQVIQPAADGGTARRDAEIAAGGGAAVNAVGQMEERAAKALPQAAPLAAGAADSLDLAKKKTEAAPEGLRQTSAPKVAARSAAAPATPERDSETPLKPAPQSVTAPPAAGGAIGGIAGGQPQAFSPLPGGVPLRSWMQHDSRLWAVSDGGRIFRSEDGGRTWRPMPSPTTQDLVSVKWDAAANSLLLEDKQGRQYHAEP